MPNTKDEAVGQPVLTRESIAASHPEIAAAFRAEGASAECDRIKSVEAQNLPGHEALLAELKFDGKTTGPEAAMQILQAEKAANHNRAGALKADAPAPVDHAAAPVVLPVLAEDAPLAERAQAAWDADSALRSEFGAFATYLAFAQAQAAGSVKILNK